MIGLPSNKLDRRVLSTVPLAVSVTLSIAITIAGTILVLWFVPDLDRWAPPGWSKMTAIAAIGVLIAAGALLKAGNEPSRPALWLLRGAATTLLLIGGPTLLEYATGASFGIDLWLPHAQNVPFPGRPSPQTAIGFLLLAAVMFTRQSAAGRSKTGPSEAGRPWLADGATLALIGLILVQICGHIYGALALQGLHKLTIMSPHTLVSFGCITFAMVMRRAEQGTFLAVLLDAGLGSRIVRLALPAGILMPLIVFTVEASVIKTGIISAAMARALMASAESFVILCLVTWMGTRINRLEHELHHISLTDELTKVYNRRGFYLLGKQAVLDATRARTGLTLFFFDLDGLKRVNDLVGHEAGSQMIQAFAGDLVGRFRKSDIVGRLGGDEFAVLTIRDEGIPHQDILTDLEQAAAAFNGGNADMPKLRFSVGHTQLSYEGTDTLERMIERADVLMYLDKGRRKDRKARPAMLPADRLMQAAPVRETDRVGADGAAAAS